MFKYSISLASDITEETLIVKIYIQCSKVGTGYVYLNDLMNINITVHDYKITC